ncbi:hypothetical protein [Streptomyces avermitilis]|uniref:hypothetical protein n=1 Tax=Streptomyces avermitilis TaxID=33903 RepID=UPI0034006298
MTKGHFTGESSTAPLLALRVERTEGRPVHHTQAGRIAVPLVVMRGTEAVGDAPLVLTAGQTEVFYEEIGALLYPSRATESAPAAEAAS